MQILV